MCGHICRGGRYGDGGVCKVVARQPTSEFERNYGGVRCMAIKLLLCGLGRSGFLFYLEVNSCVLAKL